MDNTNTDYAPQSPDLSAYHSSYDQPLPQNSFYPQQPQQPYPNSYGQSQSYDPFSYHAQIPSQSVNTYQQPMMPRNGQTKHYPDEDGDWNPEPSTRGGGSARKGKKQKVEDYCDKLAPGVEEGIKVATKFPVARIKRIMQADEDVGKVAQVTPTAVCKAAPSLCILNLAKGMLTNMPYHSQST